MTDDCPSVAIFPYERVCGRGLPIILFGATRQRFTLAARSWIATQVVHSQLVTCRPRTRFECHFDGKPGQLLRKIAPASRKHALERGCRRLCPAHRAVPATDQGDDERCRSKWLFVIFLCLGFAMNWVSPARQTGRFRRLAAAALDRPLRSS